jgi:hypothetical protein
MRRLCGAAILVLALAVALEAQPASRDARLAQLQLPMGAGADWRQWDSFLTNVVKRLAQDLGEPQRDQLRDLFLDSRYQLVQTLSDVDSWLRSFLGFDARESGRGLLDEVSRDERGSRAGRQELVRRLRWP